MKVPMSSVIAQKTAERHARAAHILERHETGIAKIHSRIYYRSPNELRFEAIVPSETREDGFYICDVVVVRRGDGEFDVTAYCTCADKWGRRWCGGCKHEFALVAGTRAWLAMSRKAAAAAAAAAAS